MRGLNDIVSHLLRHLVRQIKARLNILQQSILGVKDWFFLLRKLPNGPGEHNNIFVISPAILNGSYRRILVTGGSGGSGLSLRSDDLDSVVELYTADDLRQLVVAAQTMPTLLRGLRELEDHSECGLVREATP